MSNPRKRRGVIFGVTAFFILAAQIPNLINFLRPWEMSRAPRQPSLVDELKSVEQEFQAGKFDAEEYLRRQNAVIEQQRVAREMADRDRVEMLTRSLRLANIAVPVGWLPLGIASTLEGNLLVAFLSGLGMAGIGSASLWRAYRTTIQIYRGQFTAGQGTIAKPVAAAPSEKRTGTLLVEARIPGLSEPVAAIALAGFRSLLRAPEARMMLLSPVILGVMFGSALVRGGDQLPVAFRPLVGLGGITVVYFGLLQIMVNQFGFDRDGFRVFVLSAASRRDILFGKNLSFAPLVAGLGAPILAIIQFLCPMRLEHLLAMVPQFLAMFFLFCPLANLISIYAPVTIAAGSLKPASPKLLTILLQTVMVFILFPMLFVPMLIPLGAEFLLDRIGWSRNIPVYLLVALLECGVVVVVYRLCLRWEGALLQEREQKILEAVTNRPT
jgi:hypothetical protein